MNTRKPVIFKVAANESKINQNVVFAVEEVNEQSQLQQANLLLEKGTQFAEQGLLV